MILLLFLFGLQSGKTPFMYACGSFLNRSLKVRYLDEKGADCRAKDFVRFHLFATNSINISLSFLFRKGRRLYFALLKPQSVKMT